MPEVFGTPGSPDGSHHTAYFALTGPKTVFSGNVGIPMAEITDGTANTVMLVESKRAIPWTKPEDVAYDSEGPLPKLGGLHEGGFNVLMADGAQKFLEFPTEDEEYFRLLFSKSWMQDRREKSITNLVGKPAPNFVLKDLADQDIKLSDVISGNVALVAFSPVDCLPCRAAAPRLTKLYEEHKASGLVVLTVNPWEEPVEQVQKYVHEKKLSHQYLIGGSKVAEELYDIHWWPTFCWLDHKGIVVDVEIGFEAGDEQAMTDKAVELLKQRREDRSDPP
jgi:prepilin-type processing-associated H-X9-DG protein